jgi:folate-binding protein YgfZ
MDPRCNNLGVKIYYENILNINDIHLELNDEIYNKFRIMNGVPEGINEILKEKSFPLELNYEYLNGISFKKGCYLGQELTARTFHTGEVRYRLVPFFVENKIENEMIIYSNDGEVGEIRSIYENMGLARVNMNESFDKILFLKNGSKVHLVKPYWMMEPYQKK